VVGVGRTKGQLNVAVAVCIDPSLPVASAMMTAPPVPYAVTIPAVAPKVPEVLVFTGKTLGAEEIQFSVGEFVRSLVAGGVENVPIARNCPVSCKLPTVIEVGMMASDRKFCGAAVMESAIVEMLDTTVPSGFNNTAVMTAVPVPKFVTSPVALTDATDGILELQVS
jgi:hypothetical protein